MLEVFAEATKAVDKALASHKKSAALSELMMWGISQEDWEKLSEEEKDAQAEHWRSQRKYADGSAYKDSGLPFLWAVNWGDRTIDQLEALLEGVQYQWKCLNEPTELLEKLYQDAICAIEAAIKMPDMDIALYAAQQAGRKFEKSLQGLVKTRKAKKGPTGHAAKENSWLTVLDDRPEWTEQKPRGKGMGWKVSATTIQAAIQNLLKEQPDIEIPDTRTINRERSKRLKKQPE